MAASGHPLPHSMMDSSIRWECQQNFGPLIWITVGICSTLLVLSTMGRLGSTPAGQTRLLATLQPLPESALNSSFETAAFLSPSSFRPAQVSRALGDNCPATVWMPPFRSRLDLGSILKAENIKIGAELGVQKGKYAAVLLEKWQIAEEYVMVDLWAHQENYHDLANHNDAKHNSFKEMAIKSGETMLAAGHVKKLVLCQNFTTNCALQYPDEYFDFIYVDARHDYKGVLQDLVTWWPKLKPRGIMAGHDYVIQAEVGGGQDWTINYDGTRDETGRVVKGAVDDFFSDKLGHLKGCPRQVVLTYRELFNTWAARK